MQWFVNEVREKFREIEQKIESLKVNQNDERVTKLEGEIRAMKARMGKKET